MIKILDYGMGNIGSLLNMISKAGGHAEACSLPSELESASAVVLPGVGSFDNGMLKLRSTGLLETLYRKVIEEKTPFLGVCLGMQLLFDKSEEGDLSGLGWMKGDVVRFDFPSDSSNQRLKVPHMGWNVVNPNMFDDLFAGFEGESRFYFVHSYHVNCANSSDILATANYGYDFTCAVRHGNIWGTQFHPEKSHRFGVQFFKNFLREIRYA